VKKAISVLVVIVSILIVVAAGASAFFVYTQFFKVSKAGELESIIPGRAISYFYSYNLNEKINDSLNSPFYKKISGLLLSKPQLKPLIEEWTQKFLAYTKLFSSDAALAMFSSRLFIPATGVPGDTYSRPELDLGRFLLLTRLKPGKDIRKEAEDLVLKFADGKKVQSSENYKGVTINVFLIKTKSFRYAFLGDVLTITNDQKIIQDSIDLLKGESSKSLLNNPEFKELTKDYIGLKKKVLWWSFVNNRNYYKDFMGMFAKGRLDEEDFSLDAGMQFARYREVVKEFFEILKGTVAFSDYTDQKRGTITKSYQFFDASKDKYNILDLVGHSRGLDQRLFKAMPANTIASVNVAADPNKYYAYIKRMLALIRKLDGEGSPPPKRFGGGGFPPSNDLFALEPLSTVKEFFQGLKFEKDILPLLGENFGFFFSGLDEVTIKSSQPNPLMFVPMPIPQLSLCLQLKKPGEGWQLFDSIIRDLLVKEVNAAYRQSQTQASAVNEESLSSAQEELNWDELEEVTEAESLPQAEGTLDLESVVEDESKAEPESVEEIEDILTLGTQSHLGTDITTLKIKDIPVVPNYFLLDDYLVISSSLHFSQNALKIKSGQGESLAAFLNSGAITKNIISDNSYLALLNFKELIQSIARTQVFTMARQNVTMMTQNTITQDDLNTLIDILDDITLISYTYNLNKPNVGEIICYMEVEGL